MDKRQIHGDGWPSGKPFLERMVESGKGTMDHFGKNITYEGVQMPPSLFAEVLSRAAWWRYSHNDIPAVSQEQEAGGVHQDARSTAEPVAEFDERL